MDYNISHKQIKLYWNFLKMPEIINGTKILLFLRIQHVASHFYLFIWLTVDI